MTVLDDVQAAAQAVAATASGAVVGVGGGRAPGSGVVIGSGLVATNAHNVRGEETTVTFSDGRTAAAEVRGADVDADVAVLAVDTGGITPLAWGDADSVSPGTVVFALANPAGRGVRVSFGLVSAVGRAFRGPRGRRIAGSIEHTAPLPRGSSGGPVVGADGRLLGLNTNRLDEGFYLAVPADAELRARLDALGRGETPRRPRLGVGFAPARVARELRRAVGLPDRDGLLVRHVREGGPADQAGIRTGDLVVAAAGSPVTDADAFADLLDATELEGSLTLVVVRGTEELEITVSFAPTPERLTCAIEQSLLRKS